jgi:hypothetical protein
VAHLPKICARKRFVVRGISCENVVLFADIHWRAARASLKATLDKLMTDL